MQIFPTYKNIPETARGAVLVIGNFDGVHKGHQALVAKARGIAGSNRKIAVLTFEPHPHRLFRPDEPPGRLTPPDMKAQRLQLGGVDYLFAIPFDWDFASQPPEAFIKNVLQDGLKASHVVVGQDFRFGQLRKGAPDDIRAAGIPVTLVDDVIDQTGQPYSSSRIRQALRHGEMKEANELLGWEWEIQGEVIHGDSRGRDIGYPTANIRLGETIHPAYGIYAAKVNVAGEREWYGAAVNIGIRPMFEIPEAQVESYIFDFSSDIYGKTLRVCPVERLRGEAKFDSIEELKKQIEIDCAQARKILTL